MKHPIRTTALVAFTAILLTGCSTAQTFTLFLTVRSAEDGKPLEGVSLNFDTHGGEETKHEVTHGYWHPPATTGNEGTFSRDFLISPYPDDKKHWYLKLKKEGFETEAVDIKPSPLPKKSDGSTPLRIEVRIKPLAR